MGCVKHRQPTVPMTPTKKRIIKVLWDENWSLKQLSDKLGVHKSQISHTLKKLMENPDFYAPIHLPGCPKLLGKHDKPGFTGRSSVANLVMQPGHLKPFIPLVQYTQLAGPSQKWAFQVIIG